MPSETFDTMYQSAHSQEKEVSPQKPLTLFCNLKLLHRHIILYVYKHHSVTGKIIMDRKSKIDGGDRQVNFFRRTFKNSRPNNRFQI